MKYLFRALVRGTALFLGCFSLTNTLVSQLGSSRLEDIWWIDLSFMPAPIVTILSLLLAFVLLAFALKPAMSTPRKLISGITALTFAAFALINTLSYYQALDQGQISSRFPVPFSLVMLVIFLSVALAIYTMHNQRSQILEVVTLYLIAALWLALFPLLQIELFGRTNYEAKSQIAVVFGARVYPNGTPSATVRDRMDTAIDLYTRGLVKKILITGGVDADGIDETKGMKNYALEAGVPATAMVLDNKGSNTDASVINTTAYFRRHGITKVLAVSKYYHLPRIKMAYRAQHFNVRTVPAFEPRPIVGEWFTVAREVPAFWVYWMRSGLRDVGSNQKATSLFHRNRLASK